MNGFFVVRFSAYHERNHNSRKGTEYHCNIHYCKRQRKLIRRIQRNAQDSTRLITSSLRDAEIMFFNCTYSDPVNIATDGAQFAYSKASCSGEVVATISAFSEMANYNIGSILRLQWMTGTLVLMSLGIITFLIFMKRS